MRSDARGRRRHGAIAVQFALFAFGCFAIAAVVIDMRLAMLAQQQMQVAADAAAVEAVRQRDAGGLNGLPDGPLRSAARQAVLVAFDDDFDPDNGDPMNYGAGPMFQLTGGRAESNALARISIPAEPVYDPDLWLNTENKQHGDIVTGSYIPDTARGIESSDYARNDFTPGAAGAALATQDSVLVRIRRTPLSTPVSSQPENPLDRETYVSSAGPPLSFLFGLGTSLHRTPGSAYNPRTDGLTVRATAIASARRAMQVSGPGPAFGFARLQRFVLVSQTPPPAASFPPPANQFPVVVQSAGPLFKPPVVSPNRPAIQPDAFTGAWDTMAVGTSIDVQVELTGYLRPTGGGAPPIVGYFSQGWIPPNAAVPPVATVLTFVGQVADTMLPLPVAPPATLTPEITLVPIVRPIEGYFVVIGFGRIQVDVLSGGATPVLRITKRKGEVLPVGASAAAPGALAVLTQIPALKLAHSNFADALLAPVLER